MPEIGLSNLHYAPLTKDDAETLTYGTPVAVPNIISANISPSSSSATLYADDGPADSATTIGEISLELNVADLPFSVQAALLGHTMVNGELVRKTTDTPPYVAVGFKTLKSNGKYRYLWLAKGKFQQPEQKSQTKEDKVTFQTPTIKGSFVRRDNDKVWIRQGDEDDTEFTRAATWFNSVEPPVAP